METKRGSAVVLPTAWNGRWLTCAGRALIALLASEVVVPLLAQPPFHLEHIRVESSDAKCQVCLVNERSESPHIFFQTSSCTFITSPICCGKTLTAIEIDSVFNRCNAYNELNILGSQEDYEKRSQYKLADAEEDGSGDDDDDDGGDGNFGEGEDQPSSEDGRDYGNNSNDKSENSKKDGDGGAGGGEEEDNGGNEDGEDDDAGDYHGDENGDDNNDDEGDEDNDDDEAVEEGEERQEDDESDGDANNEEDEDEEALQPPKKRKK